MAFDVIADLADREVRLFPSLRISSDGEAEQRATAALLAVIKGVTEFGRAIARLAGGPAGRISCYTEVCFPAFEPEGPKPRPDGIIRSVWGKQDWKALVEVKVGDCPLQQEQFDVYQRVAREHDFDAVITISSQAARADGLPPLNVDGRRTRALPVIHLSWHQLLSEAQVLAQKQAIADADQAWMLSEWVRYVLDESSRIMQPAQLGPHWGDILKAAREGSLHAVARYIGDLIHSWEGYLGKEALRLRALLGVDVQVLVPLRERKEPESRFKRLYDEVLDKACLTGAIRIPDAASNVTLDVMLPGRAVRFGAELQAPSEGRQQTRLNWISRQLKGTDTPTDLVVKVEWDKKGLLSQAKLDDVQRDVACLLRDGHNQLIPGDVMPRRFLLEWTRPLQNGRGRSTTTVLKGVSEDLEGFYRRVVQRLEAYVPPAPKLPKEPAQETSPERAAIVVAEAIQAPELTHITPLLASAVEVPSAEGGAPAERANDNDAVVDPEAVVA
jgi:hypothetical protein